jgi:hypothetical protein
LLLTDEHTLWYVPTPLVGTPQRIVLWAQVLTGLKLGPHARPVSLSHEERKKCRQRLEALGGAPQIRALP